VLPSPPDRVTRKTLIRYYIAKYLPIWLARFPRHASRKLPFVVLRAEDVDRYNRVPSHNIAAHFREFCASYMHTNEHFGFYGW
jgi:hypothetical protein